MAHLGTGVAWNDVIFRNENPTNEDCKRGVTVELILLLHSQDGNSDHSPLLESRIYNLICNFPDLFFHSFFVLFCFLALLSLSLAGICTYLCFCFHKFTASRGFTPPDPSKKKLLLTLTKFYDEVFCSALSFISKHAFFLNYGVKKNSCRP